MNFMYTLHHSARELADLLGLPTCPKHPPCYHIAPGHETSVLRPDGQGGRELVRMRWRVITAWDWSWKDCWILRAGKLHKNFLLKSILAAKPCVIPVSGFFVRRYHGQDYHRYYIHRSDQRPFLFAGVCCEWMTPLGELTEGCAVLSINADPVITPTITRMPLLLAESRIDTWLAHDLLTPCPFPETADPEMIRALTTYRLPKTPSFNDDNPRSIKPSRSQTPFPPNLSAAAQDEEPYKLTDLAAGWRPF